MSTDQQRRWCLFTSAGDRNAIRGWLSGNALRRWDLIVAYYGDDDHVFSEISQLCCYAFRTKGSKFQNLKQLFRDAPHFFDRYSHVWVCDDDIVMSGTQIEEAFCITENLGVWVAQPADRPEGRLSHWITCFVAQWDYRIVNFVEVRMPIFRRDKLIEFLAVYDSSLVGWGVEYWFANLFKADEFGRFAIIDKIQVINPRNQQKGGSEIDQLQTVSVREACWRNVRDTLGLVQYRHRVFAYCKLAPKLESIRPFLPIDPPEPPINLPHVEKLWRSGWRRTAWLVRSGLIVIRLLQVVRRSGWRDAIWILRCGLTIRRQLRAVNSL